jgi:hypothetical protein
MLDLNYDFATCVKNSEKVAWRVDDVMPPDAKLDFTRPALPADLTGAGHIPFLSDAERLRLNQINGNAYIGLFAFVEVYITRLAVQQAQAAIGDHNGVRALVRLADEEVKHQQLFERYLDVFKKQFAHPCGTLDMAAAVADVILSKSLIAVLMVTLHLEIMTQAHYTESVKNDTALDPVFMKMLHHHWLEEAQHARIDAIELDKAVSKATAEGVTQGFDDYLGLIDAFDGLLAAQAKLDVASLQQSAGREFSAEEQQAIEHAQHAGYRHTFLVLGMQNRLWVNFMQQMSPEGAARVAAKAAALSGRSPAH